MQFQPGDLVRLKSGGPVMVIERSLDRDVACEWIDIKGNRYWQFFNKTSLIDGNINEQCKNCAGNKQVNHKCLYCNT